MQGISFSVVAKVCFDLTAGFLSIANPRRVCDGRGFAMDTVGLVHRVSNQSHYSTRE